MKSEHATQEQPQMTMLQLTAQLRAAHIDYSGWGTTIEGSKPIEKLLKELNTGDCKLIPTPEGLVRQVEQSAAYVYARDEQGRFFKLKEDRQIFPGGRDRRREMYESFREKLDQRSEGFEIAVKRGLAEELPQIFGKLKDNPESMYEGIYSIGTYKPAKIMDEDRPDYVPSYPGLPNSSLIYWYTMMVPPAAFIPEGYETEEDGKVTYFVWEEIGPDDPYLPITKWEKMAETQRSEVTTSLEKRIANLKTSHVLEGVAENIIAEYLFLSDRVNELCAMEGLENDPSLELEMCLDHLRTVDLGHAYPQLYYAENQVEEMKRWHERRKNLPPLTQPDPYFVQLDEEMG